MTRRTPGTPFEPFRITDVQDARRRFLRNGLALGGLAAGARAALAQDLSRNLPPNVPEWETTLGAPILASAVWRAFQV